ncbi:hypothetical protein [Tautonia sociabilis]|uniref:Uncharacterized protein n=1 Tax=Tautonia sociabilis TaxID=2080755 RepID=A0A432MC08_9BACT|nr:hypothetical protein [Tautonia sociabilis]RUL81414.1 hypothetical protein TsocGM_25060 [Tautonia sociabilis]
MLTAGVTAQSLFEMAANVAEARRILRIGRFEPPLAPTLRVDNVVLNARAGRLIIQFRGAEGGGLDPASLPGNVLLVRRQSPGVLPREQTLIGQPTVLPNAYRPVDAGPPTSMPVIGVVYDFGAPLPRGNYRVLIRSGGVRDLAGRPLDGEFSRTLPSGNGVPGGDFQAGIASNGFFSYRPRPVPGPFPSALLDQS